jgi:hypothetical protein
LEGRTLTERWFSMLERDDGFFDGGEEVIGAELTKRTSS